MEVRGGIFQPTGSVMKEFYSGCCNIVSAVSGGWLHDSKLGVDLGFGFFTRGGAAKGSITGRTSQERFNLLLLPMQLDVTYRIDYGIDQPVAPYVKTGVDLIYFRESGAGSAVKGVKSGLHGAGGIMVLLDKLSDQSAERQFGINDIFFITEARYQWVDNFGGSGLNLSGYGFSAGIHMQM